jgi:hypothetical protein
MDGDPAVEPELDPFSLVLPLPYRVALIFVLGKSLVQHFNSHASQLRIDCGTRG